MILEFFILPLILLTVILGGILDYIIEFERNWNKTEQEIQRLRLKIGLYNEIN